MPEAKRKIGRPKGRKDRKQRKKPDKPRNIGPYVLTPSVQRKIVNGIILGLPTRMLGPLAGVYWRSYYGWLERGNRALEKELKGESIPEEEQIYVEFAQAVDKAVSKMVAVHLGNIKRVSKGIRNPDGSYAIPPNWQASMTLLERKFPEDFGRKDRVEHSGDKEHPIDLNVSIKPDFSKLSVEELKQLRAIRDKLRSELPGTGQGDSKAKSP